MLVRSAQRTHTIDLIQGDITRFAADAIVNAANSDLMGGGGVDGAIHRAAGRELLEACRKVKAALPGRQLETGGAVATPAFKLPAKTVIHCVGPVYMEHVDRSWPFLASCYTKALAICREQGLDSVAFPSISTGVFACPVEQASVVALRAVRDDLAANGGPTRATFVLFDAETLRAYEAAADVLGSDSMPLT